MTDAFAAAQSFSSSSDFSTARNQRLADRPSPKVTPIMTAHVGNPMVRIDYCFVSQAIASAKGAFVDESMTDSDHFPVVFDLVPSLVPSDPSPRL
jgi:endonuclease/exonuclease/phosphatase family metal-dependent hydrolase